jgi:CubicO group peptidase (beta-lactamase class C family)
MGAVLLAAAALLWPIYGFVSHQFGVARSPFGWLALPDEGPGVSQAYDPTFTDAGRQSLAVLESWRRSIAAPSLSAAVVVDGRLVWAGATGWSDVEKRVPVTPASQYRLGSTSKAITATLLARLVDEGVVTLDAPIDGAGIKSWNDQWTGLTPRQLASHTAGLVGYEENRDWIGLYQSMALQTHFRTPAESLSVFDSSPLMFHPGSDFHYSSYDVVLLSAVMAKAAERSYPDLLSTFVTGPLGLPPLGGDGMGAETAGEVRYYDRRRGRVRTWRSVDLSHKLAAGGLVASPATVARIGAAWLDPGFITPATRESFWTPVPLADGRPNPEDYAVGWRRKTWDFPGHGPVLHLNHGGISKGAQCWLMVAPRERMVVAVSMNGLTGEFFDFADVSRPILSIFLDAAASPGGAAP